MDVAPLKVSPAFRRLWLGSMFSTLGYQVSAIAIALEIFDITGSPAAVGLTGLVAVTPLVIGGLYGGVIADHYDRRKVALAASLGMWLVAVALAAQAWAGWRSVWVLYTVIFCESLLQPIDKSARGAIIPRLIKKRMLPAANALNMTVLTLSMSVGPMLGGALVALTGYPLTYTINIAAMMVGLWALYRLPPMRPDHTGEDKPSPLAAIGAGLRFVREVPVVGMTFVVDLIGMVFAQSKPLIPALAVTAFGGGTAASGVLLSATAAGSFLGVTFSGWLSRVQRQGRFLTLSYVAWGAGLALFGLVALSLDGRSPSDSLTENLPAIAAGCAGLAFSGWADALGSVYRSSIIQTVVPDRMLGRMNGLFIVTVVGGPNLGAGVIGFGAELMGPALTAVVGGLVCMVAIGVFTACVPALWRYVFEPLPETSAIPYPEHNPDSPATGVITVVPPRQDEKPDVP